MPGNDEASKGRGGRPTKLSQVLRHDQGRPVTVAEHVVAAIRAGNYVEAAAASAGVNKDTVYDWLRQGARLNTDYHQGRITLPRPGSTDRQLMEFSDAVAAAEAEWEVAANATLERLSRPRQVEETRTTVETPADGKPVTTKTVTLRKTEEADPATIRWRLERRYPNRYGRTRVEVSGPDGGPIPLSVREQASEALAKAAAQLAENAANLATAATGGDPDVEAPT